MKKIFLTLALIFTFSFAKASNGSEKIINSKISIFTNIILNTESSLFDTFKLEEQFPLSPKCTATCTVHLSNGATYTASAGNWFTSCKKASTKCKAKLSDMIFHK